MNKGKRTARGIWVSLPWLPLWDRKRGPEKRWGEKQTDHRQGYGSRDDSRKDEEGPASSKGLHCSGREEGRLAGTAWEPVWGSDLLEA